MLELKLAFSGLRVSCYIVMYFISAYFFKYHSSADSKWLGSYIRCLLKVWPLDFSKHRIASEIGPNSELKWIPVTVLLPCVQRLTNIGGHTFPLLKHLTAPWRVWSPQPMVSSTPDTRNLSGASQWIKLFQSWRKSSYLELLVLF